MMLEDGTERVEAARSARRRVVFLKRGEATMLESESESERREWSLFSSHGQVLVAISRSPGLTVRRLSQQLGFSERRIMGVLRDLEKGGLITTERRGRQNLYTVDLDAPLRAPILRNFTVGDLLRGLGIDQAAG